MALEGYSRLVVRGGWPGSLHIPEDRAQRMARNYVSEIQSDDLSRVDGKKRDVERISRLMHSVARNAEQATTTKTMIGDMTETGSQPALAADTVDDYLVALKKIFVLEEISPWSPNLRSVLRINKKPKYHFVDPSLPAAILKATARALVNDLQTFGFLFECLCVRDLLTYAQVSDIEVFYYRDTSNLEVDLILESADGQWAGIEIKLGHSKVDQAAESLMKLNKKIVGAGGRPPAFLAVIEGMGDYSYQRNDGIHVIPISTLTA